MCSIDYSDYEVMECSRYTAAYEDLEAIGDELLHITSSLSGLTDVVSSYFQHDINEDSIMKTWDEIIELNAKQVAAIKRYPSARKRVERVKASCRDW